MATTATRTPILSDAPARPTNPARGGLRNLVFDVAVPVGSYYVARAAGCDLFAALVISSALPLLRTVVALVRGQKLDGLALVVLTVNAVSLAISFWSGNPRFMLAKDGAVTSILALAILASVLARRPLMTAGMRLFVTRATRPRKPPSAGCWTPRPGSASSKRASRSSGPASFWPTAPPGSLLPSSCR